MKYRCTFVLLPALLLFLTACGGKQVQSGKQVQPGKESMLSIQNRREKKSDKLDALRAGAQAEGCICSVAFLGAALETGEDIADFLASEEAAQYLDAYPFIREIPPDRWIIHPEGGYEVYCVVPTDPKASVAVNTWDINGANAFRGESGQVLYRSDCGDPILLLGNISDIMPSMDAEIVDSMGGSVSYQPFLSLYDGSLSAPSGIFDFTLYHEADVAVPQTENGAGGSYYYQDLLQDDYMGLINCAYAGTTGDGESPEEHAEKSVARLTGNKTKPQDLSVEKNSGYSEALGCPVYILTYTTGRNEDTSVWKVFMTEADGYTYLYAFSVWADAYADREDTIDEVFGQLCFSRKSGKRVLCTRTKR